MTTEVIILAQGTQQRLGMQHGYKQLLPLHACGGVPNLVRTLALVRRQSPSARITLVSWRALVVGVSDVLMPVSEENETRRWVTRAIDNHIELPDPGNSSLKGIARYLEHRGRGEILASNGPDATIVLLGDVVYSWACMGALWAASLTWGFVGTKDLSSSGGELWGVAWSHRHPSADQHMMASLRDALLRHPPFNDEYQPGQMRRWISGIRRGSLEDHVRRLAADGHYVATDGNDYTMDVDLPHHIPILDSASRQAAADDARHGIVWPGIP